MLNAWGEPLIKTFVQENGLTFKTLASIDGVGTHGGSEDHTAILTCQAQQLSAYSYVPVRHLDDVTMPARAASSCVTVFDMALPSAGMTRVRFEGSAECVLPSQPRFRDSPSVDARHNAPPSVNGQ